MTPAPLVLLDLDGTLTDSAPGIVASARAAYAELGIEAPAAATLRTFVGPPIVGSFLAHGVAPDRIPEAIAAYRSQFQASGRLEAMLESTRLHAAMWGSFIGRPAGEPFFSAEEIGVSDIRDLL